MNAAAFRNEAQPLIAVICRAPILSEALTAAFDRVAVVQSFPARRGDTIGLLRWLEPDGVVVDTQEEAEEAARFARDTRSPLVHVSLRERKLRVLRNGRWEEPEGVSTSPESIRNVLLGGIFGRRRKG